MKKPMAVMMAMSFSCAIAAEEFEEAQEPFNFDLIADQVQLLKTGSNDAGKSQQLPGCSQSEPTVHELVKAAWDEAGLLASEDLSRKRRVRISGWLPRLSGGVSHDWGDRRDYRWVPGSPRVDQSHQDIGLAWDVGISWDMSDMAYKSEEIQITREASRRARERMDLAAEVIRLCYSRKKLIKEIISLQNSDVMDRYAQTTATLNVWTGNRFVSRWCDKQEVQP